MDFSKMSLEELQKVDVTKIPPVDLGNYGKALTKAQDKQTKLQEKAKNKDEQVEFIKSRIHEEFRRQKFKITVSGMAYCDNDPTITGRKALKNITNALLEETNFSFKKDNLEILEYNIIEDMRKATHNRLKESIKFKPDNAKYADDIIYKIISHFRDNNVSISSLEIDCLVFKAVLHQVKKKLFYPAKTIDNPLVFIFFGAQKIGKSRLFQEQLFNPLNDVYHEAKGTDFAKGNYEKHAPMMSSSYVLLLDELQKLDDDEIDNFKSFITSPYAFFRSFYSQDGNKQFNCATVFASTNRPLADVVYDATGNRRFYQFTALQERPEDIQAYYQEFNDINIDYYKLWQGINEGVDNYITENDFKVIQGYQESWANKTLFTQFITESEMFIPTSILLDDVPTTDIINIKMHEILGYFSAWAAKYQQRIRTLTAARMLENFANLGLHRNGSEQAVIRNDRVSFPAYKKKLEEFKNKMRGGSEVKGV